MPGGCTNEVELPFLFSFAKMSEMRVDLRWAYIPTILTV